MTDKNPSFGGSKYNGDKIQVELVDLDVMLLETAKPLTIGAIKYDENNWKKGLPEGDIIGALERHLIKFKRGELIDPDTGTDHRANMLCNMMFWMALYPLDEATKEKAFNLAKEKWKKWRAEKDAKINKAKKRKSKK